MKNREELCKKIDYIFKARAKNQVQSRKDVKELSNESGMPIDMCSDFITGRVDIETSSDFQLYHLMAYYLAIKELQLSQEKYYSKTEINKYSKTKYEKQKLKFPIKIPAIQVTSDQWIGVTSVKQLMEFRDAELIRYNENTQRTLQRIIDGSVQFFKIMLNKSAIDAIRTLLRKNLFIPNTLTLNIPEYDMDKIKYNAEEKELSIKEIDFFDIIDGYHRYIALSNEYNVNKDFDYPMEIRIVCFEETKAQQFIHQEDQKTEMKRMDSDAYNQNDLGNLICQRLNETQPLSGKIGLNNALINKGVMRRIITLYLGKKDDTKKMLEYTKVFRKGYEELLEENNTLLDKTWSWQFTAASIVAILNDKIDIKTIKKLAESIEKSGKRVENISKRALESMYKEVS